MSTREYFIDMNDPDGGAAAFVNMHRDGLVSIRGHANDEAELEWEIHLYDYILQDPAVRFKQYQDERFQDDYLPRDKREVAAKLGWDVK